MTDAIMTLDIAAIKARADKATAGPWAVEDPLGMPSVIADGHKQVYDWTFIAHVDTGKTKHSVKADRNAEFIAHARTDIPDLLSALEAAERERDALKEALKPFADFGCYLDIETSGYDDDCKINAFLPSGEALPDLTFGQFRSARSALNTKVEGDNCQFGD